MNMSKMMGFAFCGAMLTVSAYADGGASLTANALLPEGFNISANQSSKPGTAITGKIAQQKVLSAEGVALKDNIKVEYGEGHGETFDEALKEAMKDVLQKVVGVYVDSDFRINNDEIIKDEIITHSNGFIDHYKKMEEIDDANGRGKTVTIKAWVKMRDFVNRMKKIAPSQTVKMDGAILYNNISNEMNAELLLKKEIENLDPAMDLMEVTLIEGVRPVVRRRTDESVTFRYVFKVRYSKKRYYNEFLPRLSRVLDQIAERPHNDMTTVCKVFNANLFPAVYDPNKCGPVFNVWDNCPIRGVCLLPEKLNNKARGCVRAIASVDNSGVATIHEWKLSERLFSVYGEAFKKSNNMGRHVICRLILCDAQQRELAQTTCELSPRWYLMLVDNSNLGKMIDFAPFCGAWGFCETSDIGKTQRWSSEGCARNGWYDKYVGCLDINIDLKDVSKISTAVVKLETNNKGEN